MSIILFIVFFSLRSQKLLFPTLPLTPFEKFQNGHNTEGAEENHQPFILRRGHRMEDFLKKRNIEKKTKNENLTQDSKV